MADTGLPQLASRGYQWFASVMAIIYTNGLYSSVRPILSFVVSTLPASKYHSQRIRINKPVAWVGGEHFGQRHGCVQQDHARLIQVGIVVYPLSRVLRLVEDLVEFVAIEIVAAVNGDRIVRHIPHQESAPAEVIVKRTWLRILAKEVDGIDRVLGADRAVETTIGEVGAARTARTKHGDDGGNGKFLRQFSGRSILFGVGRRKSAMQAAAGMADEPGVAHGAIGDHAADGQHGKLEQIDFLSPAHGKESKGREQ